jgi:signal transduction histidine kinase
MMKTLTFRLTWQFALLVTLTTVAVLAVGGWLLGEQAERGLELMHDVEGHELAELLEGKEHLTASEVHDRIEVDADSDAALYFIQVHNERGEVLFRSDNLGDVILPNLPAKEPHWTTTLPGIGDVRVSEFHSGPWHIQVASALRPIDRLLLAYVRTSGFLVAGVALAGLGLGFAFSRITLRPVRAIEQTARRIGADNLRERVPVPAGRDELADLALLLNRMFDRLESSFDQVKRFTADASHELKTPLALIRLNAERLRARLTHDPEATAGLEDLLEEIARMNRIIESLLFIAKAESGALSLQRTPQDMPALLAPFAEDARVLAEDRGAVFSLARNDAGSLRVEPALLRQLLLNLTGNALNVSPAGGLVTLESACLGDSWRLTVTDEGPGLPEDQLENVFGRFVRFEQAGGGRGGHGLGLTICRSIAELHGGTIRAENRGDGRSGLRVRVELPR